MLHEVQTWWTNLTPETVAALQVAGVVVGALLSGLILGGFVTRVLASRDFDATLRLARSAPTEPEADRGITPTFVAGWLVRLTVWAGAFWWLAQQHGRTELADRLALVLNRTWAIAMVLVSSLALANLLASRLIACLGGSPKTGPQAAARQGGSGQQWDVAGIVGAGVYVLVLLLVLLISADVFDWPLTRDAALALWQFAQHLLVACAALFIGCLGAGWARDLAASPEGAVSPEKRAGQYTALGIVAATTILAVAVLLSSAGVLLGLSALAILAFLLWIVRGYLPDVTAGLQLRAHKIGEVYLDGEPWQVVEVGFLTTQVTRRGDFCRLQNRQVLEARMHAPTPAALPR